MSGDEGGRPPEARVRGRRGRLPAAVWGGALCVLAVWAYVHHSFETYRNVNESARIYQVRAAVRDRALTIDHEIEQFGDLQDRAQFGGHAYSDKPIGLSLVGLVPYAALHFIESFRTTRWSLQRIRYLLTVVAVSLPSMLLLLLLFIDWQRWTGDPRLAAVAIVVYGLGTMACVYATQFMGHQLSAVLVYAHFALAREQRLRPSRRGSLGAGLLAGLGCITQYLAAPAHLAIALGYFAWPIRPRWRLALYALGGLVGVLPLLVFNTVAFEGPFDMAYGHEALPEFQEQHTTGFYGVAFPTWEAVRALLASPEKGLFFLAPLLLLSVPGLAWAVRLRSLRRAGLVMVGGVIGVGWLALSVVGWRAGWTVGPRHMTDIVPFLMTGVVLAIARWPRLRPYAMVFGGLGILFHLATTLALPAFAVGLENPLMHQTLYLLRMGAVSPNLGTWAGMPGGWSLVVPAALAVAALWMAARLPGPSPRVDRRHVVGALLLGMLFNGWIVTREPTHRGGQAYHQAEVLRLVDRPDAALAAYAEALTTLPTAQMAERASLGMLAIHQQRQDFTGAVRTVREWLELDPTNRRAQQTLGQLQAIAQASPSTDP